MYYMAGLCYIVIFCCFPVNEAQQQQQQQQQQRSGILGGPPSTPPNQQQQAQQNNTPQRYLVSSQQFPSQGQQLHSGGAMVEMSSMGMQAGEPDTMGSAPKRRKGLKKDVSRIK